MEIRNKMIQHIIRRIMPLSAMLLLCACNHSEKVTAPPPAVYVAQHTLMTLSPNYTFQSDSTAIHKQYLQLRSGNEFPMIGVLRVDGKSYRFMGGDSLRIAPVAPFCSSEGWSGKYSYLYPGADWEKSEYDDSHWLDGTGAFGVKNMYYPVNTLWGANNIYVRRHISIDDIGALEGRKMYLRYMCDSQVKFYCNGEYIPGIDNQSMQMACMQLTGNITEKLHKGDNVIAAFAHNKGGGFALLDFGLYAENNDYCELDTATLKQVNVQATQTHYTFQCGKVELQIDFVSPGLIDKEEIMGCPVGLITYRVIPEAGEQPDIEILFDVDMGWSFDRFSVDMNAEEKEYSNEDGHAIFSQKLCGERSDCGALLIGYEEDRVMQFEGENVYPCWNKKGEKTIKDIMQHVGNTCWEIKRKCDEADALFYEKAIRNGINVKQILPAYRSFLADHRLVMGPDNAIYCFGDTLANVREAYKCFPTLGFFNRVDLMKGFLNPIFETCMNDHWRKSYPPYDIGTYPISGRQASVDDHSIEVVADMLLMTLAIVETENDFDYAEKHWKLLQQWAGYLESCADCALKEQGRNAYQKLIEWKQEYE